MGAMQREFLGWERMPLERAAAWLVQRFGEDLDGVQVALPGARATDWPAAASSPTSAVASFLIAS